MCHAPAAAEGIIWGVLIQVGTPFPPGRSNAQDGVWVIGIIKARLVLAACSGARRRACQGLQRTSRPIERGSHISMVPASCLPNLSARGPFNLG